LSPGRAPLGLLVLSILLGQQGTTQQSEDNTNETDTYHELFHNILLIKGFSGITALFTWVDQTPDRDEAVFNASA
jgi:hypothetical protein